MNTARKTKPALHAREASNSKHHHAHHSHLSEAASDLITEGKKFANELYHDGLDKIGTTERDIEKYTDELMTTVRKNPLKSVLIAGGVGFILSALFRK